MNISLVGSLIFGITSASSFVNADITPPKESGSKGIVFMSHQETVMVEEVVIYALKNVQDFAKLEWESPESDLHGSVYLIDSKDNCRNYWNSTMSGDKAYSVVYRTSCMENGKWRVKSPKFFLDNIL